MRHSRLVRLVGTVGMVLAGTAPTLSAQLPGRRFSNAYAPNVGYDGQFILTRIRFTTGEGYYGRRADDMKWDHGYPAADEHIRQLVHGLTNIPTRVSGGNIYRFTDPDVFKQPFAYLCEVGYLTLSDDEVGRARAYLLKGGFLMIDDFREEDWDNFATELKRILPWAKPVELDITHPIFHSFFEMKRLNFQEDFRGRPPHYYGIFENNDPTKRMLAIVNFEAGRLSRFWEWSDTEYYPIDLTNEAYKLGVNYLVYAMTH